MGSPAHLPRPRSWLADRLLVLAVILLAPSAALAFGPIAHLDAGLEILAGTAALAPALRRLLDKHRADWLYGNLAADAIVGKNLARERDHCHAWPVARRLLADAGPAGSARHAFVLGYLAHLAADVVAHNGFVPQRLIVCHTARGVGHLYWESRYDQKLASLRRGRRALLGELARLRFPEHDAFLAARLKPTLFSHAISRRVFARGLTVQRQSPWRAALNRLDRRSRLVMPAEEVEHFQRLAVAEIARLLTHLDAPLPWPEDPTGRATLELAKRERARLRRHARQRHGPASLTAEVAVALTRLPGLGPEVALCRPEWSGF